MNKDNSIQLICGADEAGRGPLMGNVVAACVLLDPKHPIVGLADSKKLTAKKRQILELEIKKHALAYGIGQCTPREIDKLNILWASLEAMKRAYLAMQIKCDLMLCDGNKIPPDMPLPTQPIVKGDATVAAISAASILAKVERDRQMLELDRLYPEYKFKQHKGYPTVEHLRLLQQLPILDCYRLSFGPVARLLQQNNQI